VALVRLAAVNVSAWEAIFMLVILKIPLIYLGAVVWWAVRAEPEPAGGGDEIGVLAPLTSPCGWNDWQRRRPRRSASRPLRSGGMRAAAPVGGR
jgi:hypothetical protein